MVGSIVWLASYMKSGNTWLRLLLANLLSDSPEPVNINDIRLSPLSVTGRADFEELTLIDNSLLTLTELDALRPFMIASIADKLESVAYIKLHEAYRRTANGEPLLGRSHARAALYVMRDPRDVAVSLAFHSGISLNEAIDQMNRPDWSTGTKAWRYSMQLPLVQLDWSSHVESWIDQDDVPVHVMRYEDMRADTVAALSAAADFLNLDVSLKKIAHAVRCADFCRLQQQEREVGFCERPPVRGEAAPFFRSGRAGGWREVLTTKQEHAISEAHTRVMARFGYF
ncbi:sulfotransferase domain-containing protein [Methylomonas fluvii]|uniref:Sulfotransferase domain-containing protein n=1 Tax=Methylomonas fluvii TaxID=1854564 RepID=A0ABR9DH66_9GAMM|nr:sulfotransferase domain-containing protein [Methylomonas fluvii]MBD9362445.1 sulfotransferase domain-containing protein [Methylomonas fluvii]CAD6875546.1 hypothetical protein [Methylomonas fluvii]